MLVYHHPDSARKTTYWPSVLMCESEEMIPARLNNPVEDVTVQKRSSLGSFSVVGPADKTPMNRVLADLPDRPQGQVLNKYDVKQVFIQTQSSIDPQLCIIRAATLHIFRRPLKFRIRYWQVRHCSVQNWPQSGMKTDEVTQSPDAHPFQKSMYVKRSTNS